MSHKPWLSVLMPVYKVEKYLRESADSVLGQDPGGAEGIELVLLDDASPDGSTEIARSLVAAHPGRVRLVEHPSNRGLAAARNTLLANAGGRYVWFLDSDDVLLPGALAGLKAVIDTSQPDLVLCDFRLLREDFGLRHRLRGELHRPSFAGSEHGSAGSSREALVAGLLEGRQLHVWSKIARREIWQGVRFPEGRFFEDMAVTGQLIGRTTSWVHVAEPWVGYRQRGDSIMARMDATKTGDLLVSLRQLHGDLAALPGGQDGKARLAADYFALRTFAALARKVPDDDLAQAQECRDAFRAVFPQGAGAVLSACRGRGWWLRGWRARRSLDRRGWLQ